jgi:hypothetical protein
VALGTGIVSQPVFAQLNKPSAAIGVRAEMSIPQIYEKLTGLGYWNIDKIERDVRTFEVRANERSGDRVRLYLDIQTGELVERRLESRKRDFRERRGVEADGVRAGECSERRCRDELPK